MRIIFILALILLSSCSSEFNSNRLKYNQLILSENNKITQFDTNYFQSQARTYLISGTLKQQQKLYAAAILEFQQALRYDSSAAIEYAVAKSYLELRKVDLAKEHLYRSIQLNPSFVQSLDLLTEIYLYNNEYDKAEITNANSIDIEKTDERLLTKALIIENKNPEEALNIYNSISNPQYQDLINERKIVLYKKLGNIDNLIEKLKSQQKLEPFNTQLSREIFQVYIEHNRLNDAIDYMNVVDTLYYGNEQETYYILLSSAILQNRPIDTLQVESFLKRIKGNLLFNEELLYYSGLLASNIGNSKKRDTFFDRVLKIATKNSDFKIGVAEVYYYDKEYNRSLDILNELNPDSLRQVEYYYTLKGLNSYMLKDYDKTIENYKEILTIDTSYNNYITLTMIGETYDAMNMMDSALYYYELQYKIDSNNAYLLNNYAYSLSKVNKDLDKALMMSEKTLEDSPDNSAYLDTYGWIKFQLKDYETALKYIKKAVEIGGVSAEVYEHLGDTYLKLGNIEKARESYTKSLEMEANRFNLEDKINIKTGK